MPAKNPIEYLKTHSFQEFNQDLKQAKNQLLDVVSQAEKLQ